MVGPLKVSETYLIPTGVVLRLSEKKIHVIFFVKNTVVKPKKVKIGLFHKLYTQSKSAIFVVFFEMLLGVKHWSISISKLQ